MTLCPGWHPRRIDPRELIGTHPRTSCVRAASSQSILLGGGFPPPPLSHLLHLRPKGWFLFRTRKNGIAIKMNALFKFYSRIMQIWRVDVREFLRSINSSSSSPRLRRHFTLFVLSSFYIFITFSPFFYVRTTAMYVRKRRNKMLVIAACQCRASKI